MLSYIASYLVMASIYGIIALALNFQWGFSGLMNFGIGASYMLGAYSAALLSSAPTAEHLGGFGVPFPLDLVGAAIIPGFIAFLIGFPALKLKGGPFAIATLAIHEIIYLIVHNEMWLTNGVWGIRDISRPLYSQMPQQYDFFYLLIAGGMLIGFYFFFQKAVRSPWGRVIRGIKVDEDMALMSGKYAWSYKMQSFVLGSAIAGIAGGLFVHYTGFVSPTNFTPLMATFIVWLMVMVGGSGNNRGVLVGTFFVWGVWTGSEFLTDFFPGSMETRAGFMRMFLMGIILLIVIITRPQGIFGKEKIIPKYLRSE
ncbi:branched-chain amino acid ABC transporter permease [Candidatus Bipolaricaulota bacterium]|nr:branched-chain amino acid ABC transporter permease [Candidatus Bipolaricaulota bacterium]MBS3792932.1 branched-chain amino acid ABC transporter permease [Candidatus Bipolaricaulota bacterium]